MFRKLNEEEQRIFNTLLKRGKHTYRLDTMRVMYKIQGNTVVAIIGWMIDDDLQTNDFCVGVAKFNPTDRKFDEAIGHNIAFDRALKS